MGKRYLVAKKSCKECHGRGYVGTIWSAHKAMAQRVRCRCTVMKTARELGLPVYEVPWWKETLLWVLQRLEVVGKRLRPESK